MAMHGNRRVIVPKSTAGDVLLARLHRENAEADVAEILDILTPGPERAPAPCLHYAQCGGCSLQHLEASAYRRFKTRSLAEALKKAGYAADVTENDVIFLPAPSRRRADFALQRNEKGALSLAYFAPRSHRKIPISQCLILDPALASQIGKINEALQCLSGAEALLESLQLALTGHLVDITLTAKSAPPADSLQAFALALPDAARISLISQDKLTIIASRAPVALTLGGVSVDVPPAAFLQAAEAGQTALTGGVCAALGGAKRVADFFCGIGTFALPLAAAGVRVEAFEGNRAMVRAIETAPKPPGHFIRATRRDLFINPLSASEINHFDAAVINPPRAGAKAQIAEIARSKLPRLMMVSCNPATFARDAATLRQAGFRLASARGVDQFVWSAHLEIMAYFTR